MHYHQLNIKRSKQQKKVIRNSWLLDKITDSILYFTLLAFPICAGIAFLNEFNVEENYLKASMIIILALTSSGLLLYAILNIDNFKSIKGSSNEENRKYVELLCENFNWKLQRHSKQRSIISFSADLFSWSREIVFIYDKSEILVNVTSYGLFKTKSPFHWFADRKTEKKIEKEILNSINNDMPTSVHRK